MSRLTAFMMVFGVVALAACGRDSISPPPPPQTPQFSLTIVGGDKQFANVRNSLTDPLEVAVRTPDGAGVAGATIAWTVPAGGGFLSASTSLTDAQGRASVVWSLGNQPGVKTAAATIVNVDGPVANFSATAAAPIILHYDGTAWSTALDDVNGAIVSLASVWGPGNSALLAVGKSCAGPLVLQFDGSHWAPPPASCPGNDPNQYTSIWGSSTSDFFVASKTNLPPHLGGSVQHSNGQSSTVVFVPPCNSGILCPGPQAVWSSSPSDAFAVGDAGMIVHYDGTAWTSLASGTTQPLTAVWGDGPGGAVFAVGSGGTILRSDRGAWTVQASGTTQPLNAIWGTSANDLFAVGGSGTVLHYDGTSWTAQNSGSTQALRSVWGSSGKVFAVGDASTILMYDGTKWAAQTTTADMNLRGVWGTSPSNAFAVGEPR